MPIAAHRGSRRFAGNFYVFFRRCGGPRVHPRLTCRVQYSALVCPSSDPWYSRRYSRHSSIGPRFSRHFFRRFGCPSLPSWGCSRRSPVVFRRYFHRFMRRRLRCPSFCPSLLHSVLRRFVSFVSPSCDPRLAFHRPSYVCSSFLHYVFRRFHVALLGPAFCPAFSYGRRVPIVFALGGPSFP